MGKTYVMSDIHGQKEKFDRMLEKINFSESDKLYILGDIVNRGSGSIELLKQVMGDKRIELIKGNHELALVKVYKSLESNVSEEWIMQEMGSKEKYISWLNGLRKTLNLLKKEEEQKIDELLQFMDNLPYFKIISVNGTEYVLSHMGVKVDNPGKDTYEIMEKNINKKFYIGTEAETILKSFWGNIGTTKLITENTKYVVGHIPTRYLYKYAYRISESKKGECNDFRIYNDGLRIDIDCGGYLEDRGRLACLRLDDLKEFYM